MTQSIDWVTYSRLFFLDRSNFLGTTFVTYSHGKNPVKREMTTKKKDLPIREELGAVLYVKKKKILAN
jgi:hypothetical protein